MTSWVKVALEAPFTDDICWDAADRVRVMKDLKHAIETQCTEHKDPRIDQYMSYFDSYGRDKIDFTMRDVDVALNKNRHTEMPVWGDFRRMSDTQLMIDALLSKRFVRGDDLEIEMELREIEKRDRNKIEWIKQQNLKHIILHRDELHDTIATLIANYDDFRDWCEQQWHTISKEIDPDILVQKACKVAMRFFS